MQHREAAAIGFQARVREILEREELENEVSSFRANGMGILSLVKDLTHCNYSDHLQQIKCVP